MEYGDDEEGEREPLLPLAWIKAVLRRAWDLDLLVVEELFGFVEDA